MSTTDTHLITSDLALAIWSLTMLVNGICKYYCISYFLSFSRCVMYI